jgi:small subunit ribosomal protein S16
MAVKIRLTRRGRKKLALYDIVVADARSPRDGRFIEKLGNYNPNTHPATIQLEEENALQWLRKGAQPTNTVRTILSSHGILLRKHLQLGVDKGAIAQADADTKLEAWKQGKAQQLAKKEGQTVEKGKMIRTPGQQKATQVPQKETPPQAEQELQATPVASEKVAQPDTPQAVPTALPENRSDDQKA